MDAVDAAAIRKIYYCNVKFILLMYHVHTLLQREIPWYITHIYRLTAFFAMVHLKCTMAGHDTF